MRSRLGLSLIECLVALLVLALGLTGASLTLGMAGRLTRTAWHRQHVARAAQAELLRFMVAPCPRRDSAWTRVSDGGFVGRWMVVVRDSMLVMRGEVFDPTVPAIPGFPMEARRRCP